MNLKANKVLNAEILFAVIIILFLLGCDKDNGSNIPLAPIDITINPNSTFYQELNIVGGWVYLDENDGVVDPSRGIIVYRMSIDEFLAYERTPPYQADSCCNASKTLCTKLIVDNYFPFIMDTCTLSKYSILDGSPVSGPSKSPLGRYFAEYNGQLLYIHN